MKLFPIGILAVLGRTRRTVIIQPTLPFDLGTQCHVLQRSPAVMRGFPHLQKLGRGDVEHLRKHLILIPEQTRPHDKSRREAVDLDVGTLLRIHPTLQLPREQDVAQLAVLVRLVGVELVSVDHIEHPRTVRHGLLQPLQVAQRGRFSLRSPGRVGIVDARRRHDNAAALLLDEGGSQQEVVEVEVSQVIRPDGQFESPLGARHVRGPGVARQTGVVAHGIEGPVR
mmetsp:Transcript_32365/g.59378  ORF Transcript_32365/g.59378 Transcript_32365/m.59378 type:complete len:226 (+) Transcript_32365:287-964(+)